MHLHVLEGGAVLRDGLEERFEVCAILPVSEGMNEGADLFGVDLFGARIDFESLLAQDPPSTVAPSI